MSDWNQISFFCGPRHTATAENEALLFMDLHVDKQIDGIFLESVVTVIRPILDLPEMTSASNKNMVRGQEVDLHVTLVPGIVLFGSLLM